MLTATPGLGDLLPGFRAENALEERLTSDPRILAGLAWGSPQPGHPEGRVGTHVAEMLRRIPLDDPQRSDLRAITIVHDAAKVAVRREEAWSPDNDHAVLARRLAEAHTEDDRLLTTIELHDEAYWCWRRQDGVDASAQQVLARVTDAALLARFVELDASTEGKDLSFLWWFRRHTLEALPAGASDWSRAPLLGDQGTFLYVKEFAVEPAVQPTVGRALQAVTADGSALLQAEGRMLLSEDGLRALLVWRFRGDPVGRLLREGAVVRRALRRDPVLLDTYAVEARLYRLGDEGATDW
jgi:hypothetical protein